MQGIKRITVLLMPLGLLVACSPNEAESIAPAAEPDETSMVAGAPAEGSEETAPDYYVEFMWCWAGDSATEDTVAALLADTDRLVDELGGTNLDAFRLKPSGWTSDEFDFVDAMWWPGKATRDAVWQAWTDTNAQARIDAAHPGVESCGGEDWTYLWGFNAYVPRPPTSPWTWEHPPAAAEFQFCSYNEEKGPADLQGVVRGPFGEFLNAYDAANGGGSGYFFAYLHPDFELANAPATEVAPAEYDFVWANYWETSSDRADGMTSFNESGGAAIQAQFDEVASCGDPRLYEGTWIIRGDTG